MAQGIGTLGGLTVLGVELPYIRGTAPSVGLVRLLPADTFDRFVDDLTFSYGATFTLTDCAVADCPFRWQLGRESYRWDAIILDRRWKWRYPRISGEYNRRMCNGEIDPHTKKNARELGDLLFEALGEGGADTTGLPDDTWPYVNWDDALARLELQWLCDLFAAAVCPKVASDTFAVEAITDTAELPAGGTPVTPDTFSFKPSVMPSALRVQGSPLVTQGWIDLQAVGLNSNGQILILDMLDYRPPGGWEKEWPSAFPNVPIEHRHLAFQTVYRWYRPTNGQIVLLDHVVEEGYDLDRDRYYCLPPQVKGVFYTLSDLPALAGSAAFYSGAFRIRKDLNLVEFAYPIFKLSGGTVLPADIKINTGYRTVGDDGQDISTFTKDKDVPQSVRTTKKRVLRHPELLWRQIVDDIYLSGPLDNTGALDAESQVYLDAVADGYAFDKAQDVVYDGLLGLDMTGALAQVRWNAGNERPAFTRVGVNTEFDIHSAHHQQRRAQERLAQMAERFLV